MKKNFIAGKAEYFLVKSLYAIINFLPVNCALAFGRFLGITFYRLDKKHAKSVISNLKIAFGIFKDNGKENKNDEDLKKIAINFYKNLGMIFIEIFRLNKYNKENIDNFVEADFSNIKDIYGEEPILLLTAHFGNWELLAKTFSLKGYRGNVLARPLDNEYIEQILYKLRTASGNKVIYNRENAVKEILTAINNNEIIGFLPDENASKRIGIFVDFFGKSACTMPGIANIAAKTRATVVPAFIVRQTGYDYDIGNAAHSNNSAAESGNTVVKNKGIYRSGIQKKSYCKHKLIIGKPLKIDYTGNRKEDVMNILNIFNRTIEDIIKEYPEQWFWIHNRWKTRPDNDK
jgi:KDO2-lipid IV(A) lauroyltransferase